jgi:CRP/FNR family transcriptional regulator, cyclic AMP receptor protein
VVIKNRGAIYLQGESANTVFCVLEGQVVISRTNGDGSSITIALLGAGDFFGGALSGAAKNEDTAKAKGAVTIWRASINEFRALLRSHPDASWELTAAIARRQRHVERKLEGVAFKRVEVRLAETFRELSGGFALRCEHGFGQHLRLSQQELADLVGATRPVVSTILNKLRDQGVLGYNREYVCVRGFDEIAKLIDS